MIIHPGQPLSIYGTAINEDEAKYQKYRERTGLKIQSKENQGVKMRVLTPSVEIGA